MLLNADTFNMLKDKCDDDMELEKKIYMASTTNGASIHHEQDRSWGAILPKPNIWFTDSSTVLYYKGHNSLIQSVKMNLIVHQYHINKPSNHHENLCCLCQDLHCLPSGLVVGNPW